MPSWTGSGRARPLPLVFRNADASTGLGLYGAAYELRCEDGVPIAAAVSDARGNVLFGTLPPGCYLLAETAPPPGYRQYAGVVEVEVDRYGNARIAGGPASLYCVSHVCDAT